MGEKSNAGSDYWPKLLHIVPAFSAIGILTITSLVLIRYLFSEYLPGVELKNLYWEIVIPMVFPIIPVAIWLRPRMRILKFRRRNDDRQFLFLMIAITAMVVPSIVAQVSVPKALADLHHIASVEDIDPDHPKRYYQLSEELVLEGIPGMHADVRASGRFRQFLDINLYFVLPFIEPGSNPDSRTRYWYGIKHHRQISNRLGAEEKQRLYNSAFEAALAEVAAHNFNDQDYLEVVQASNDRDNFRKAVQHRTGVSWEENTVVLIAAEDTFAERTRGGIGEVFLSCAIGFAAFLLLLLWPRYDPQELERQRRGEMPKGEISGDFKELFIPRNEFFAAPILLDAIILVYLIQLFSGVHPVYPTPAELLEWGANRRSETMGGEWWRLITNLFLHGGIIHLLLNAVGLLLAAVFVEPVYGRWKLFFIYFASGICGSLASIWWYENTVSVGASGAIFGLFGAISALAVMGVLSFRDLAWLWVYVGLNLLFGLAGGIDNAAHLGGLIAGLLLGVLLQWSARLAKK